jgi:hypothetical protein
MTEETTATKDEKAKEEQPKDLIVESKHSIVLDGKRLDYTVTCGTIVLKEEAEKKGEKEGEAEGEKPKATIFFTAYTLDQAGGEQLFQGGEIGRSAR